MTLFQPVYEYDKDVFGRKMKMEFSSSIVYYTEELAKMRALDDWNEIKTNDDTLVNITIRQIILHYQ